MVSMIIFKAAYNAAIKTNPKASRIIIRSDIYCTTMFRILPTTPCTHHAVPSRWKRINRLFFHRSLSLVSCNYRNQRGQTAIRSNPLARGILIRSDIHATTKINGVYGPDRPHITISLQNAIT
ncbi:hypothetical protein G6O67_008824 [Ophiocordyceps sinensis]|uniref:Uncharacterized protein n=1 Tax=Ophiocordyceps sinensis TaxID=72228 RepID=A0A8H4PHW1_9HYPO|nr:hypothetical protein G6O67_008824 [Ophiocordyceps sinensis]